MKNFKIAKIQQKLKDKNIDSLIINRTDEFLNEYIPQDARDYFGLLTSQDLQGDL